MTAAFSTNQKDPPMQARRTILQTVFATAIVVAGLTVGTAVQAADKTINIGYQKYGTLILLKAKGSLEAKLKSLGWNVTWSEFVGGPALLEALNAGAIDFGSTGDAPPVFAQAASDALVYIGYEPAAPLGEAILVPKDSAIKTVADLKGKRLAFNKGSNVHYLVVKALEKAGLAYNDVQISYLAPPDARAAFENKSIDAWAIWDPYLAAAEAATGARELTTAVGLASNYQFYLGRRPFVTAEPKVVDAVIDALAEIDTEIAADTNAAAAALGPATGIPVPIVKAALARQTYGVKRVDASVLEAQQGVANAFLSLKLIPKPIQVGAAVVK
jgi:sulfonate transport system substrate-binding protein